jgi:chromosomal replication initiator protein
MSGAQTGNQSGDQGQHDRGRRDWDAVRAQLKREIGEAAFNSWLKPLSVGAEHDGEVRLVAPTRFMQDWVRNHYAERIRALWNGENGVIRSVRICVEGKELASGKKNNAQGNNAPGNAVTPNAASGRDGAAQTSSRQAPPRHSLPHSGSALPAGAAVAHSVGRAIDGAAGRAGVRSRQPRQPRLGAPLDPRLTFDAFVVGKPNELAYAASRRVAEADRVAFNPLFLYSGVGLGKTHLMHAIAWHLRESDPSRKVVYLSAEKFMYEFIRALRDKDTMTFKERFRSVDVLMVDDIQFISGRDATQEEFFHTFNALIDQNRQIVLSADKSPSDLEGIEERVRSRLGWGLVADIHATTYELRLGILQSKAERLGTEVPPKLLEFLAHKITSNVRELEGALNRVVAHATLVGREASIETAQEILHDLLRANDRRVTIEEIQKRVAEHFNIRISDMHSPRRARVVARPRQVAMYLAKQLTSRSLPEIGRKFGNRDHTTVMHAVRKIDELRSLDASFAEDVDLLQRMLEG